MPLPAGDSGNKDSGPALLRNTLTAFTGWRGGDLAVCPLRPGCSSHRSLDVVGCWPQSMGAARPKLPAPSQLCVQVTEAGSLGEQHFLMAPGAVLLQPDPLLLSELCGTVQGSSSEGCVPVCVWCVPASHGLRAGGGVVLRMSPGPGCVSLCRTGASQGTRLQMARHGDSPAITRESLGKGRLGREQGGRGCFWVRKVGNR